MQPSSGWTEVWDRPDEIMSWIKATMLREGWGMTSRCCLLLFLILFREAVYPREMKFGRCHILQLVSCSVEITTIQIDGFMPHVCVDSHVYMSLLSSFARQWQDIQFRWNAFSSRSDRGMKTDIWASCHSFGGYFCQDKAMKPHSVYPCTPEDTLGRGEDGGWPREG